MVLPAKGSLRRGAHRILFRLGRSSLKASIRFADPADDNSSNWLAMGWIISRGGTVPAGQAGRTGGLRLVPVIDIGTCPLEGFSGAARVFADGWEDVCALQAEQAAAAGPERFQAREGELRGFEYNDSMARMLAELCTADLIIQGLAVIAGMQEYLECRIPVTRSPQHRQWLTNLGQWDVVWKAAARYHASGEIPPGSIDTWEILLKQPYYLEVCARTTSTALAAATVNALSGLAEFFDAERRSLAS